MSTFNLNIDSTGVDKLLMEPGVFWSYSSMSTTYTLTPTFDTELLALPSDVQVWYSNDGSTYAYNPVWITSRTGNSINVTVADSTTIYAKLHYAGGTEVLNENGASVAVVSTTIGGTTVGAVTVTGSAAPTEGIAESYSASFTGNATDATYLWTTTDGGATIATPTASSTDITFSTGGSFDVTCTVSSVTASDSPQADTLGVTVASAAEDWDTHKDGIWLVPSTSSSPSGNWATGETTSQYTSTAGVGFIGWFRSGNYPASRYWDAINGGDTYPPAVAVWSIRDSVWLGWSTPVSNGNLNNETVTWNVGGEPGVQYMLGDGDNVAIVHLTQAPSNFSNWNAYDGPTS